LCDTKSYIDVEGLNEAVVSSMHILSSRVACMT
jgi:hypothetical protein